MTPPAESTDAAVQQASRAAAVAVWYSRSELWLSGTVDQIRLQRSHKAIVTFGLHFSWYAALVCRASANQTAWPIQTLNPDKEYKAKQTALQRVIAHQ